MPSSPFVHMQKAVEIVNSSPHPTNKIAATVFGTDKNGNEYSVSKTNFWPKEIVDNFGTGERIGNSSGTIHAETACILDAPYTENVSICITDPFCPNCAKNIAESGIKTIYIDHKGFNKDFAVRRQHHFESMSMQICEKAGISVYEIWRKEEKIIPIFEVSPDYTPIEDNPVTVKPLEEHNYKKWAQDMIKGNNGKRCATVLTRDITGQAYGIFTEMHPVLGYSHEEDLDTGQGKYNFWQEPVTSILMSSARLGLLINKESLMTSCVPTSREQVNLVGASIYSLSIYKTDESRDLDALKALKQLESGNILKTAPFN